jgi:tetratricopeptide (TPR) repeat protein
MVIRGKLNMSQKNLNHEKNNIIYLFNQKKFDKISKISSKILDQFNEEIEIVKIVVISYLNQKNYFKAEQYLKNSLSKLNSAELNYFLGNTLKIQDKNLEAINAYKKSISLKSDYSEAYNNLANVQKKIGMLDEASSNYLNAINCKKDNIEAYYNLANLQKSQKKYKDAIKNYNQVIKINSNFTDAYNNIGAINSILGKFEEAKKFFIKAIEINNLFSEPYKNYVQSTNIKENDKIFNHLLKMIKQNNLNEEQKEVFYYSASKGFFDLNKNDDAFKYLNLANEIKFSRSNYSFKKEKKEFKEIKDYFYNREQSNEKFPDQDNCIPIFILGMPRSGTSLVEQIISNHSEVHGAGELDLLPISVQDSKWQKFDDFSLVIKNIRSSYFNNLKKISSKKYITDKLPGNFKRIGFILNAFPEAKIVHLERNPMAVCWSNYKSNFNSPGMSFTLNQELIGEYYLLYKDLIGFWEKKYPKKIINLNYESLVENYKEEVKKLFLNLNLKWEKQLFDFHKNKRPVETASFRQVRSKIYKKSSEQWQNYKEQLKPMIKILSENKIVF